MKRSISLLVLAMVSCGVILNHLSITQAEQGTLLVVDGKPFDVIGAWSDRWTRWTARCDKVERLTPEHTIYKASLENIKNYSPPASEHMQVASVWAQSDWALVEVEFKDLLPALVVLQKTQGQWQILPKAIWSGYTAPWKAAPFVRHYITTQAPELPRELSNCFELQSKSFK